MNFTVADLLTNVFISATELDNGSLDETEYDAITSCEQERSLILSKSEIYLSDLARKDTRVLTKKSYSYLWHVLTVGLFYLLPAVQLVITYQRVKLFHANKIIIIKNWVNLYNVIKYCTKFMFTHQIFILKHILIIFSGA